MSTKNKLLAVLFLILFLIIIPLQFVSSSLIYIARNTKIYLIFGYFENYHIVFVTFILLLILGFMVAKKTVGSYRSSISLLSLLIIAVASLYDNPLKFVEDEILLLALLFVIGGIFIFLAEGNRKKVPYVLTIVGAIIISFVVPIYTLVLFGFIVFIASSFLFSKTRSVPLRQKTAKESVQKDGEKSQAKKIKEAATIPAGDVRPGNGVNKDQTHLNQPEIPQVVEVPPDLDSVPSNAQWPGQSDYSRAMQNLSFSISQDYPDILSSSVVPNPYVNIPGNVVYSSGNYGTIFKLQNSSTAHALKCFTRSKPDLSRRYYIISKSLSAFDGGGIFVNFNYLPKSIRTLKNPAVYFPSLLMQWIDGQNLNAYISEHLDSPRKLQDLARNFLSVAIRIHSAGIAHGDLSGDNIMVSENGSVSLVDYDGMFVPALKGLKATENGHDHFQHPNRNLDSYSSNLDNFSVLVIYLSILAVSYDKTFWAKYNKNDQDCLIFRRSDFTDPSGSAVLSELLQIRGRIKKLARLLIEAVSHDPLWDGINPENIAKIQR